MKTLTTNDLSCLSSAITKAKNRGKAIEVGAYTRCIYTLPIPAARLARFRDAERAIVRLSRHLEINGSSARDKARVADLISLLEPIT